MSDQTSGGQSKVTAGEIIRDGWAWVKDNTNAVIVISAILVVLPVLSTVQLFFMGQPLFSPHEDPGLFAVSIILFVVLGFTVYLSVTVWFIQKVLGLRTTDGVSLRAKRAPLKLLGRFLIAAVCFFVVAVPIAFVVARSPFANLILWPVSLVLTSYILMYWVGAAVQNSPGLSDSLSAAHKNFLGLFPAVLLASLPSVVVQVFTFFLVTSKVGTAQMPEQMVIFALTLMATIAAMQSWVVSLVFAATAYKKIIGLPDNTSSQTSSVVASA